MGFFELGTQHGPFTEDPPHKGYLLKFTQHIGLAFSRDGYLNYDPRVRRLVPFGMHPSTSACPHLPQRNRAYPRPPAISRGHGFFGTLEGVQRGRFIMVFREEYTVLDIFIPDAIHKQVMTQARHIAIFQKVIKPFVVSLNPNLCSALMSPSS